MGSTSPPRYESAPADPQPLGEPLEFPFSHRCAINRFLKGAMSERLASWPETDIAGRGIPTAEYIELYRRWGEGGWGQLLTGNIQIHPEHVEAAGNATIHVNDDFEGPRFEAYKAVAEAAKAHGSLIVGQVSHGGRQVSEDVQKHPISASDVQLVTAALGKTYGVPRPATKEDIDGFIKGFTHAAVYLERAGFDGIQLHGAHGYLLAQFLSPTTNHRTDEYGGSLENRMRLILEIAASIKKAVSPRFILGIKINSVEFQEKGFTPEEAVQLCQALEGAGFDYVETSGGTYESLGFVHKKESTRKRENFFIEFAEQIHRAVSRMKVYTTGGFVTVGAMVGALGSVDGVGIGRAATQEPSLAKDILAGKVSGVIKPDFGEGGEGIWLFASNLQIKQIGRGEEPMLLSERDSVNKVRAVLGMPKL